MGDIISIISIISISQEQWSQINELHYYENRGGGGRWVFYLLLTGTAVICLKTLK